MKSDLDHENEIVGIITVLNAKLHSSDMSEAVDVLCAAMRNSLDRHRAHATTALGLLGDKIVAEAVKDYEAASRSEPDNIGLRILLPGHYSRARFVSNAARTARQAQILWIIEHVPESSIAGSPFADIDPYSDGAAYEAARQLWMAQVETHPENTAILGNAASFLTVWDKTKCGELLRRAKMLEPENPRWTERLAHLYSLEMMDKEPAARRDWAAMTLAEYESGQEFYRDDRARLRRLPNLAVAVFEAGEYTKARTYVSELLSRADAFHRGDATFYGNQILGRLALVDGDVAGAKTHLRASAETSGSPVPCSFGPSMVLAKVFPVRDERGAVLDCLERCALFWKEGADHLARWADTIKRGETPDFRPM